MSAWTGSLPKSITEPMTPQQEQAMKLLNQQRAQQQANEKIGAEAESLVKKVEAEIAAGGGTPQGDKHQYNYGVKGKYLDEVVSAACGIWAGKGAGYSYRGKSWKKDWGNYQTNFEQTIAGWTHNVHVTHNG